MTHTPLLWSPLRSPPMQLPFLKRNGNIWSIQCAKNTKEWTKKCGFLDTLSFYNNEPSKNKHFLILLSSLSRNSQELKLKRIFEIPWVLLEKSLSLYFDWTKSWIWWTLEKVMNIFSKWHIHNASKEVFWQKKFCISCTGSKVPLWQNGEIAKMALLNGCMKFTIFFAKRLLLRHYENAIYKKYS